MKRDLPEITPRALSLKLTELQEYALIEKVIKAGTPVIITYLLTEKGRMLTGALGPIQQWAQQYKDQ
jgi:DNA-binding HxlR family transcriptional regulator